jgi:hypothetical protein
VKKPWLKFYVRDWIANPKLSKAPWALRGIWCHVLCLLWMEEEAGIVREDLATLARMVGCRRRELADLADRRILKGTDGPVFADPFTYKPKRGPLVTLIEAQPGPLWFSSRMVVEAHLAAVARRSGKKGHRLSPHGKATPRGVGSGVGAAHPAAQPADHPEPPLSSEAQSAMYPSTEHHHQPDTPRGGPGGDDVEELLAAYKALPMTPQRLGRGDRATAARLLGVAGLQAALDGLLVGAARAQRAGSRVRSLRYFEGTTEEVAAEEPLDEAYRRHLRAAIGAAEGGTTE